MSDITQYRCDLMSSGGLVTKVEYADGNGMAHTIPRNIALEKDDHVGFYVCKSGKLEVFVLSDEQYRWLYPNGV